MKHAILLVAILLLLGSRAYPQQGIADWFPVHRGDKWIYEHQTRDAGINGNLPPFEVHQWKTEETTVGFWTVPEGTLIASTVRIIDGSPPPGWHVSPDQVYLIHDSCLYRDVGWDSSAHRLSPNFRKPLEDGWISADFCFPLLIRKTWGAHHYFYGDQERPVSEARDWKVAGINFHDSSAPDKGNTFHIASVSSYLGSGMTDDIWFEKGVGIIREELIHHGTIGEERSHLIEFQPAYHNQPGR